MSGKWLSRAELGVLIHREAASTVLLTGLIFVLAGSLWAHFALGSSFLAFPLISSWICIHSLGFLSMRAGRLRPFFLIASFAAIQVYFYVALKKLEMPYLPLAPVFFIISSAVLSAFRRARLWPVLVMWAASWSSALLWLQVPTDQELSYYYPLMFAAGSHVLTFVAFFSIQFYFSAKLSETVNLLGPQQSFDDQRLQAAKLQTVGELTSSLIHEINNPLNNINGYSHQLSEAVKDRNDEAWKIVELSNERIKFNVDRINEITRAVKGFVYDSRRLQTEPVSLRRIVEDSLILIKQNIRSTGTDLSVDLPETDYKVPGNAVELSQLLVNLLSNARDACRLSDRKKISMGFGLSPQQQLILWVEDTGPGIPDENKQNVFKAFFTTKDHMQGTGLGLYISKLIADRHQAALDFDLIKGSSGRVMGTRFSLNFGEAYKNLEGIAAGTGKQKKPPSQKGA